MPRYRFETGTLGPAQVDSAVRLAAHRFPEIAVERRPTADAESRMLWVCRAPSEAHLHRWAEAAQLALTSVRHLNAWELDGVLRGDRGDAPIASAGTSAGEPSEVFGKTSRSARRGASR